MLLNGDCLTQLKRIEPNSIDSLVTDPPAGISFMGNAWDDDKGGRDAWIAWLKDVMTECMRVLKPGAHGLVWALPRTSHWTATACEDAGFEIRDVVTHLFGSGFPKSLDVSKAIDKAAGAERSIVGYNSNHRSLKHTNSMCGEPHTGDGSVTAPSTDAAKQWQGFGTALKPASEHWILVRKPLSEKTVAKNVLKWGTGALNIDASRVGSETRTNPPTKNPGANSARARGEDGRDIENWKAYQERSLARGPSVVNGRFPANLVLDEEAAVMLDEQAVSAASRFFYVAKASRSDKGADNTHPTVKSTKLMSYLIKLVTPPGGTVLDPFMGSGSTGVAATYENFKFVGIEKDAQYFEIANGRIERVGSSPS